MRAGRAVVSRRDSGASSDGAAVAALMGGAGDGAPSSAGAQPVLKASERFDRRAAVDADSDVAKRVFDMGVGSCVRLHYHYGANRVTATWRVFPRDGSQPQVYQVSGMRLQQGGCREWQGAGSERHGACACYLLKACRDMCSVPGNTEHSPGQRA